MAVLTCKSFCFDEKAFGSMYNIVSETAYCIVMTCQVDAILQFDALG